MQMTLELPPSNGSTSRAALFAERFIKRSFKYVAWKPECVSTILIGVEAGSAFNFLYNKYPFI